MHLVDTVAAVFAVLVEGVLPDTRVGHLYLVADLRDLARVAAQTRADELENVFSQQYTCAHEENESQATTASVQNVNHFFAVLRVNLLVIRLPIPLLHLALDLVRYCKQGLRFGVWFD